MEIILFGLIIVMVAYLLPSLLKLLAVLATIGLVIFLGPIAWLITILAICAAVVSLDETSRGPPGCGGCGYA